MISFLFVLLFVSHVAIRGVAVVSPTLLYTFPASGCASKQFPEANGKASNMILSGPSAVCRTKTVDGVIVNGVTLNGPCSGPNNIAALLPKEMTFPNGISMEIWLSVNDANIGLGESRGLLEVSRHTTLPGGPVITGEFASFDPGDIQLSSIFSSAVGIFGDFLPFGGPLFTTYSATKYATYGYCSRSINRYILGILFGGFSDNYFEQFYGFHFAEEITKIVFSINDDYANLYLSTVSGSFAFAWETDFTEKRILFRRFLSNSYLRLGCSGKMQFTGSGGITYHRVAIYNQTLTEPEVSELLVGPPSNSAVVAWQVLPASEAPWYDFGFSAARICKRRYRSNRKRRIIDIHDYVSGVPVYNNVHDLVGSNILNRQSVYLAPLVNGTDDWSAWWKTPGDCPDKYSVRATQSATAIQLNKLGVDRFETKSCASELGFTAGTYRTVRLCLVEVLPKENGIGGLSFITDANGLGDDQRPSIGDVSKWQLVVGPTPGSGKAMYRLAKQKKILEGNTVNRWVSGVSITETFSFNTSAEVYDPVRTYIGTIDEFYSLSTASILPSAYTGMSVWAPGAPPDDCAMRTTDNATLTTKVLDPILMGVTTVSCNFVANDLFLVEIYQHENGTLDYLF